MIISTPVTEHILKKIADLAFAKWSEKKPNRPVGRVVSSAEECELARNEHIQFINTWSKQISFTDLRGGRETHRVFVPLDVLLQPRRTRIGNEAALRLPLDEVLEQESVWHAVILGQPGAGKTTSLKHFCLRLFNDSEFFAESRYPILVQLRELNSGDSSAPSRRLSLFDKLQSILNLRISFPQPPDTDEEARDRIEVRNRAVKKLLEETGALVLLDGFDEISSREQRDAIIEEIQQLATELRSSRLVLTTRTGEFEYHISNASQFEISPLSDGQILQFAQAWLGSEDGQQLLRQIRHSPYADASMRPLTLAHLCAIYERIRKVPDKPKTVYRKIVNLLLSEWDEQRLVRRESAYSNFDTDRKFEFLAHLAYILTCSGLSRFERDELIRAYETIHQNFGLPLSEAVKVAKEIESYTGLLVRTGYESYEFTHKSLQEFLAAEHLRGLANVPFETSLLLALPNELAIATAIASEPSEYIATLAMRFRDVPPAFAFMRTFLTRLFLERPDFEMTDRAGVSLLSFYSKFLESCGPDRLHQTMRTEAVKLEGLIAVRVPAQAILQVYEPVKSIRSHSTIIVLRRRRRQIDVLAEPIVRRLQYELPNDLYVTSGLIGPTSTAVRETGVEFPPTV